MAISVTTAAVRAVQAVQELLEEAGIPASRDRGSFHPQTAGVLVDLPTLVGRGLASRTFEVPVLVVSGDPMTSVVAVDRLYALADDAAFACMADNYRPSEYRESPLGEPLRAIEITVTVTVTETEEQ